jgi:hypothetical protein
MEGDSKRELVTMPSSFFATARFPTSTSNAAFTLAWSEYEMAALYLPVRRQILRSISAFSGAFPRSRHNAGVLRNP